MSSSAGSRRQNSARDKSKPLPKLGGPALRKNTSHLVVCGATDSPKKDVWLFGDFLGFVDALRKADPPIHGDFVNCFPLGEYFDISGEQDIKFGRGKEAGSEDWESKDEIPLYTRRQYDHRETWWTQVDQPSWPSAKSNVLRWIESRSHDAKQGDIVTIILIGHGDINGIQIGGVLLPVHELAGACACFAAEVQVNIVVMACSSGAFAKAFRVAGQRSVYVHTSSTDEHEKSFSCGRSVTGRVRNSLFGASFIETFGLMKDEEEIWTLEKQKKKLESDLSGPLVPISKRSLPQVVSDSPKARLMWDIMFRDYIDLSFDRAPINARRVLTPINEASRIQSQPRRPSEPLSSQYMESYAAARVVLEQEMSQIDIDWPEHGDMDMIDELLSLDRHSAARKCEGIEELIRALSYRFRFQEEIFVVAESLMYLGLLSHESLYSPMMLSQPTASMHGVLEGLKCFGYVIDATSPAGMGKFFDAPAAWLAAIIVRSCTDWTRILDRLVTIQRLGSLDPVKAAEVHVRRPRFTINPQEAVAKEIESPQFGFWLPHGVSMKEFAESFLPRYCSVKEAYEGIVGEGTWGDSSMFEAAVTRILATEREA